jgi:hypothetical protein
MIVVVHSGQGDVIERMWRLVVSARRNEDTPEIWRLTEDIIERVADFYRLAPDPRERTAAASVARFLDIPVDPTSTMPHLLCRPNVVYHL